MRIVILLAILIVSNRGEAQLLPFDALDTIYIYENLEEALKYPDSVQKLVLKKRKFTEFPIEILQFKQLNYLDLGKNKLEEIPAKISELKFLQYLSFSKNRLTDWPVGVCELKNLRTLVINQNEMYNIHPCVKNLENLVYLDLWSNELESFPEELKELHKLEELDLRAILINKEKQRWLKGLLPGAKVHLSPPCNCGN